MGNKLSELIEVASATFGGTKPLDVSGDIFCSFIRIVVVKFLLILLIEALLLHQWIMNELIVQEFIENVKLFHQEFVESVDDGAHHTDSVGLDGVEHLVDSDCFNLFCFGCCLNENLCVQIIIVFGNKFAQVSEQL